ncbi:Metallo-dependent phosphatase-like protein [Chlamydoabsidia padenii]|nr:Metallo-dependent phosphatase-like protein [Chlamydoabsidia padenii]
MWYSILLPFERYALDNIVMWRWWGRPSEPPPQRFGYFLHITDFHIDESYVPGATIDSACHRSPSPFQSSARLAGRLGSPKCDSPIELAQQTLNWIKKEWRHKLDFVVWTGDNARHDWDDQRRRKRKHIYQLNEQVQKMMVETFWPTAQDPRHIPLVPSIGNNDVHPHNTIGNDHGILSFYSQLWHPWIPTDQQPTFQSGGYFAVDVGRQLRVLSLNTMYFYNKNDAVRGCHRPGLAQDHILWFERQLVRARSESIKVYISGHIPPSPRDFRPSCLQAYTRLASSFSDLIVGHFYGHLNMDHFLMYDRSDDSMGITRNVDAYVDWLHDMYSSLDPKYLEKKMSDQTPLVVIQVAPSILPIYFPALRIYRYEINDDNSDPEKLPHGSLLGYQQYFANITRWENDRRPLEYQLEYDTRQAYGLTDLTVDSYYQLAKEMVEETGQTLWTKFVENMFVQTVDGEDLIEE